MPGLQSTTGLNELLSAFFQGESLGQISFHSLEVLLRIDEFQIIFVSEVQGIQGSQLRQVDAKLLPSLFNSVFLFPVLLSLHASNLNPELGYLEFSLNISVFSVALTL